MATRQGLKSAKRLASKNPVRFPNESAEYRRARTALLAEEIDCADMSSASQNSAARCRMAGRYPRLEY